MGMQNIKEESSKTDENRVKMADLGWKKFNTGMNKRAKVRQRQERTCHICGKTATVGDMCDSCREFIKNMKEQEGAEHGKYGRYEKKRVK